LFIIKLPHPLPVLILVNRQPARAFPLWIGTPSLLPKPFYCYQTPAQNLYRHECNWFHLNPNLFIVIRAVPRAFILIPVQLQTFAHLQLLLTPRSTALGYIKAATRLPARASGYVKNGTCYYV